MRAASDNQANAVQPSTAPSRRAFSPPATDSLFRPNQEISPRARNHQCSPGGRRSTRQFAVVPTPLRKNQQALATLFSRRLGDKVKKHKWPRSPDSLDSVHRPPVPRDTPGRGSSLGATRFAQDCYARTDRWAALSRDGLAHDKLLPIASAGIELVKHPQSFLGIDWIFRRQPPQSDRFTLPAPFASQSANPKNCSGCAPTLAIASFHC